MMQTAVLLHQQRNVFANTDYVVNVNIHSLTAKAILTWYHYAFP